ncbi:hypothetical protein K440DRAFT_642548 [Wilcoxina mikolae CBS 423.85]|nr:hypothetical protein K440DRAFT_642548 [Wilcoxina mikolae CBS 423.85]
MTYFQSIEMDNIGLPNTSAPNISFPENLLEDLQLQMVIQQRSVQQSGLWDFRQHAENLPDLQGNISYSARDLLIRQLKARLEVIQNTNNQVLYWGSSANDFSIAPEAAYVPSTIAFPSPWPLPIAVHPSYFMRLAAETSATTYTPITANISGTPNYPAGSGSHSTAPHGRLGKCYKYGDCSETLPLAVVASISSQTGPATEIHCLAAFTSKLCEINSIAEDGSVNEHSKGAIWFWEKSLRALET